MEHHLGYPTTDEIPKKILRVFEGKKIHITTALQAKPSWPVIARRLELNKETTVFKGGGNA